MAAKEKTRNGNTWTDSQYWGAVRSALRSKMRWWKPANQALLKARRPYKGSNKLQKWEFLCAKCGKWHLRRNVQIDHIVECGSLKSSADIAPFLERLTNEDPDGYQILCKECHRLKTNAARQERTNAKRSTKLQKQ